MLDLSAIEALLGSLHANGYRLRRVTADSIEVADAAVAVPFANLAEQEAEKEAERRAFLEEERAEAERTMWAHIGGKRPEWLRRPEEQPVGSPWADTEGKPQ